MRIECKGLNEKYLRLLVCYGKEFEEQPRRRVFWLLWLVRITSLGFWIAGCEVMCLGLLGLRIVGSGA